jgi:CheY-like chemotaxis protein
MSWQTEAEQPAMLVARTGYGAAEDRRRSQHAGFNAHLVKPVDLVALKHLLACPSWTNHEALD